MDDEHAAKEPPEPQALDLPQGVWWRVASFLDYGSIYHLARTCRSLWNALSCRIAFQSFCKRLRPHALPPETGWKRLMIHLWGGERFLSLVEPEDSEARWFAHPVSPAKLTQPGDYDQPLRGIDEQGHVVLRVLTPGFHWPEETLETPSGTTSHQQRMSDLQTQVLKNACTKQLQTMAEEARQQHCGPFGAACVREIALEPAACADCEPAVHFRLWRFRPMQKEWDCLVDQEWDLNQVHPEVVRRFLGGRHDR